MLLPEFAVEIPKCSTMFPIKMIEFRYMRGAVYIFENADAQRIKVGMTTNDVALRLRDVNDMWLQLR